MSKDSEHVPASTEFSYLDLLNTIAVKVPTFWPECAKTWLAPTEAPFALQGVTVSSTKLYYCVSSFNQETAVLDLIKSPPAHEPFKALKRRLLKLFALGDYQRYMAILPLVGHMKPSKRVKHVSTLAR